MATRRPKSRTAKHRRLSVLRNSSLYSGGCVFCNEHCMASDELSHDVFVVRAARGGGLVVRFCLKCAKEFRVTSRILENP